MSKIEENQPEIKFVSHIENKINSSLNILQNSQTLSDRDKEAFTLLGEGCLSAVNMVNNNALYQSEFTQRLIQTSNRDHQRMNNHCNAKILTILSTCLVQGLRVYVNDLLPLASGYYKANGVGTLPVEAVYAATEIVEVIVTKFHPVGQLISVVTVPLKLYEKYKERELLLLAHQVKPLNIYSEYERTAIYTNVINNTLLELATRIGNGKLIGPCAETKDPSDKVSHSNRWLTLLLKESILALGSFEKGDNSERFASNWQKVLLQTFQLQEKKMDSSKEMQNQLFEKNNIKIALKVQRIFTDTRELSEYPDLPVIETFCHEFHKKIYDFVLMPYKRRTEEPYIAAFFCAYSKTEYDNLRDFQLRFAKSLNYLATNMLPLMDTGYTPDLKLQLLLINSCLYSNLQNMVQTMDWHKSAKDLFWAEFHQNYGNLREPLELQDDGKYKMVSSFVIANNLINKLEADLIISNNKEKQARYECQKLRTRIQKLDGTSDNAANYDAYSEPKNPNIDQEKEPFFPSSQTSNNIPSSKNRYRFHPDNKTPMQQTHESQKTTDTTSTQTYQKL